MNSVLAEATGTGTFLNLRPGSITNKGDASIGSVALNFVSIPILAQQVFAMWVGHGMLCRYKVEWIGVQR